VLHSSNLYGTEKMALATLATLRQDYKPVLLSPPGVVQAEAQRQGFETYCFNGDKELIYLLRRILATVPRLVFMSTTVRHSIFLCCLNLFYRRKIKHLQMVHGGSNERDSYARKKLLNYFNVIFVVNSEFVRQKLITYGVNNSKIELIENFLTQNYFSTGSYPQRQFSPQAKLKNIVVVSRIDPLKRIDLLLDSICYEPRLRQLSFKIFGTGSELPKLRRRAMICCDNVIFCSYVHAIAEAVAQADLLLHLCPCEPFGLAILEAMAVGTPVLVPDSGGVTDLVEHQVSGWQFKANDVNNLAQTLLYLSQQPLANFNPMTKQAYLNLHTRFSEIACRGKYLALLQDINN
jgi:glycosyltransferase involved in cell wall biosynthesis